MRESINTMIARLERTAAKKQIGNAVPPLLAEALYRAVLAA